MKKLYTLSLALLSMAAIGQTQRLALFEEYTGENCGPCASTNPGLDALVQSNPTKILMLKHQVPIPSAGPIYNAWPTDANARLTYYGVNSAPNGRLDGSTFGNNQTHPAYLTQSIIDSRAQVSSSFTMSTSHTVSSDLDSIYITVVVTNVDGFTVNAQSAGSLRLHVNVIEEEINFATPPGTNGEKDFYHVSRKMYPSAAGTAMQDSWPTNATMTYTFAEALPTHIYNYNEVGVVAYIQENGTKEIMQASHSAAGNLVTSNPDLSIANLTASGNDLCAGNATPSFEITNEGQATVTSADVRYRINGGAWTTQAWTGSLASGATATVNFPNISLPYASNNFQAQVTNANGGAIEINKLDNDIEPFTLNVLSPIVQSAPFDANFENATSGSVPSNMILSGNKTYNTVIDAAFVNGSGMMGGYAASNKSMLFGFFYLESGTVSELIMPKVDISNSTYTSLFFSRASKTYAGENDMLEVMISDDCGQTWTTVWSAAGSNLNTVAAPSTSPYFPTAASDWKMAQAGIPSSMQGATELIVKFKATSDYGNNLFIDNVWLSNSPLSVNEEGLAEMIIFPNPANHTAQLSFDAVEGGAVEVNVVDLNGRTVSTLNTEVSAGAQNITLDVAELPVGVYVVQVRQNSTVKTLRLNVTH